MTPFFNLHSSHMSGWSWVFLLAQVEGRTVLLTSITLDKSEVVSILLNYGADPNVPCHLCHNAYGSVSWTALHEACRWAPAENYFNYCLVFHDLTVIGMSTSRLGKTEVLEKLLKGGGKVNLKAHQGLSPLHVAAWHGHRDAVELLLNHGTYFSNLNLSTTIDFIWLLVVTVCWQSKGCDANQLDSFCESAIVAPICNGDAEVVEALLFGGCKLNSRSWGNSRLESPSLLN